MRTRLFALLCIWAPTAGADFGVGAFVGDDEAAILLPIRFSAILVEPQFGYTNSDVDTQFEGSVSMEGYSIGVGLFGLKSTGENLSIYYGARLADENQESSSPIPIGGGFIAGTSESEIDGYSVTPTAGLQYTIDNIMIGAEIGWEYSEADLELTFSIAPESQTLVSSETSRGTVANIVFRYFFGAD